MEPDWRGLYPLMDPNSDGWITYAEYCNAFDYIDTNHDGCISRKEWYLAQGSSALFDAIPKRHYAMISREEWVCAYRLFDYNGDGAISLSEWQHDNAAASASAAASAPASSGAVLAIGNARVPVPPGTSSVQIYVHNRPSCAPQSMGAYSRASFAPTSVAVYGNGAAMTPPYGSTYTGSQVPPPSMGAYPSSASMAPQSAMYEGNATYQEPPQHAAGKPPVEHATATCFLMALSDEYVHGSAGAVRRYYDSQKVHPDVKTIFDYYVGSVAQAADKQAAINNIRRQWGMPVASGGGGGGVGSRYVAGPGEFKSQCAPDAQQCPPLASNTTNNVKLFQQKQEEVRQCLTDLKKLKAQF